MKNKDIIRMNIKELKRLHVIKKAMEKQLNQFEAASLLGLSERQIGRIVKAVKINGESGIVHKGRGKASNRKLPVCLTGTGRPDRLKQEVLKLYEDKYLGFGPTLAKEKLEELNNVKMGKETLRKWLIEATLWKKTKKSGNLHKWRQRKENFGQMIQLDGSHHDWLEGRGEKLVLMGYIDDATSKTYGRFYDYEGTLPALNSFKGYVKKYGLPLSVYLDKHTTYRSNGKLTIEQELKGLNKPLSQFERALKELGVEVIHAHSPQAKGRIERLFGTCLCRLGRQAFQDRLIKEMRLAKICNKKEANDFLASYLPKYNQRFSVIPAKEKNLHQRLPKYFNLDKILCIRNNRTLRDDNTIAFRGNLYLIEDKLTAKKIAVEERTDGSIRLNADGKYLKYRIVEPRPKEKEIKENIFKGRKQAIPPANHPWREPFDVRSKTREQAAREKEICIPK